MIKYILLIWIGIVVGMPAEYFVLCGISLAANLLLSLVKVAVKDK